MCLYFRSKIIKLKIYLNSLNEVITSFNSCKKLENKQQKLLNSRKTEHGSEKQVKHARNFNKHCAQRAQCP